MNKDIKNKSNVPAAKCDGHTMDGSGEAAARKRGAYSKPSSKRKSESTSQRMAREVRSLRIERNYSQQQVADMLGIKQQSYSRIEHGTFSVGVDLLDSIAEIYGLTVGLVPKE